RGAPGLHPRRHRHRRRALRDGQFHRRQRRQGGPDPRGRPRRRAGPGRGAARPRLPRALHRQHRQPARHRHAHAAVASRGGRARMDYKDTLNLPKTSFPMKANLSTLEPELLARWKSMDIYGKIRKAAAARPLRIFHDGPPFTNGHTHMGAALNKIPKDVPVKTHNMLGLNAMFVPGWDCHGLPIEHAVDKALGLDSSSGDVRKAMDPVEKIRRCREYALKFLDIQREEFKRRGVFADWDNRYATLDPEYEAVIVREFGRFVGQGAVYKGLKP